MHHYRSPSANYILEVQKPLSEKKKFLRKSENENENNNNIKSINNTIHRERIIKNGRRIYYKYCQNIKDMKRITENNKNKKIRSFEKNYEEKLENKENITQILKFLDDKKEEMNNNNEKKEIETETIQNIENNNNNNHKKENFIFQTLISHSLETIEQNISHFHNSNFYSKIISSPNSFPFSFQNFQQEERFYFSSHYFSENENNNNNNNSFCQSSFSNLKNQNFTDFNKRISFHLLNHFPLLKCVKEASKFLFYLMKKNIPSSMFYGKNYKNENNNNKNDFFLKDFDKIVNDIMLQLLAAALGEPNFVKRENFISNNNNQKNKNNNNEKRKKSVADLAEENSVYNTNNFKKEAGEVLDEIKRKKSIKIISENNNNENNNIKRQSFYNKEEIKKKNSFSRKKSVHLSENNNKNEKNDNENNNEKKESFILFSENLFLKYISFSKRERISHCLKSILLNEDRNVLWNIILKVWKHYFIFQNNNNKNENFDVIEKNIQFIISKNGFLNETEIQNFIADLENNYFPFVESFDISFLFLLSSLFHTLSLPPHTEINNNNNKNEKNNLENNNNLNHNIHLHPSLVEAQGGFGVAPYTFSFLEYLIKYFFLAEEVVMENNNKNINNLENNNNNNNPSMNTLKYCLQYYLSPPENMMKIKEIQNCISLFSSPNFSLFSENNNNKNWNLFFDCCQFIGIGELLLLLKLAKSFAALKSSLCKIEEDEKNNKNNNKEKSFFFEFNKEILLEWSYLVVTESAVGYLILNEANLKNNSIFEKNENFVFSIPKMHYDNFSNVIKEKDEIILEYILKEEDFIQNMFPSVSFFQNNNNNLENNNKSSQVAITTLEKNRKIVLDCIIQLKSELYYLMSGNDEKNNLFKTHFQQCQKKLELHQKEENEKLFNSPQIILFFENLEKKGVLPTDKKRFSLNENSESFSSIFDSINILNNNNNFQKKKNSNSLQIVSEYVSYLKEKDVLQKTLPNQNNMEIMKILDSINNDENNNNDYLNNYNNDRRRTSLLAAISIYNNNNNNLENENENNNNNRRVSFNLTVEANNNNKNETINNNHQKNKNNKMSNNKIYYALLKALKNLDEERKESNKQNSLLNGKIYEETNFWTLKYNNNNNNNNNKIENNEKETNVKTISPTNIPKNENNIKKIENNNKKPFTVIFGGEKRNFSSQNEKNHIPTANNNENHINHIFSENNNNNNELKTENNNPNKNWYTMGKQNYEKKLEYNNAKNAEKLNFILFDFNRKSPLISIQISFLNDSHNFFLTLQKYLEDDQNNNNNNNNFEKNENNPKKINPFKTSFAETKILTFQRLLKEEEEKEKKRPNSANNNHQKQNNKNNTILENNNNTILPNVPSRPSTANNMNYNRLLSPKIVKWTL